jgi:hypothetical protein
VSRKKVWTEKDELGERITNHVDDIVGMHNGGFEASLERLPLETLKTLESALSKAAKK